MVSVSAGKYWTAGVTDSGDVYYWDGKKSKDEPPIITRLNGIKRATSVSVGETHLLVISSLHHPSYCLVNSDGPQCSKPKSTDDLSELDQDFAYDGIEIDEMTQKVNTEGKQTPTLKSLCEKVAAEHLVEPRSALQLLEIADSLEAHDLKKHCEVICDVPNLTFTSMHLILYLEVGLLTDLL